MHLKNRTSKSIGRALGYSDDDLTTPGHDALVLWIARNVQTLLAQTILNDLHDAHEAALIKLNDIVDAAAAKQRERRQVAGLAPQEYSRPSAVPAGRRWCTTYRPELEKKVPGGWIDVHISGAAYVDVDRTAQALRSVSWTLSVEVKTHIRSFGELLRQLRTYQDGLKQLRQRENPSNFSSGSHSHIYVAGPDDRFADDLRWQGFGFFKVAVPQEVQK